MGVGNLRLAILIAGNPLDGYSYFGPFSSEHDAVVWAERNRHDDLWWVTDLCVPPAPKRRPSRKGVKPI